jgi:hypothetical protein
MAQSYRSRTPSYYNEFWTAVSRMPMELLSF